MFCETNVERLVTSQTGNISAIFDIYKRVKCFTQASSLADWYFKSNIYKISAVTL